MPISTTLALVGIHTRGVPLAYRLRALVEERSGVAVDIGAVDITFHRDDVLVRGGGPPLHPQPVVRGTELDFPLEGKTVVLVDDVLFTGRTIRAAIDALLEYGRPARVQLAVLVDRATASCRSGRTTSARTFPPSLAERVRVELGETDDGDRVVLLGGGTMTETVHLHAAPSCRREPPCRRPGGTCSASPTSTATTSSACSAPPPRSPARSTAR